MRILDPDPNTDIEFIMKNSSMFLLNQVSFKMNPAPDSDVRIRIGTRIKKTAGSRSAFSFFSHSLFLSLASVFSSNVDLDQDPHLDIEFIRKGAKSKSISSY